MPDEPIWQAYRHQLRVGTWPGPADGPRTAVAARRGSNVCRPSQPTQRDPLGERPPTLLIRSGVASTAAANEGPTVPRSTSVVARWAPLVLPLALCVAAV